MTDSETKPEGKKERLSDEAHSDELSRMVERLWGLKTAIEGLLEAGIPADSIINGVYRLLEDVCDKMQACADAFYVDRQLRIGEERRARFE
jgi:hypothetical protein